MPPEPVRQAQPKLLSLDTFAARRESTWTAWQAFRGLLWCEWFAHSRLLLFFLAVWLAGVWLLPLYGNPAWILLFGVIFAIVAGPVYGGSDTLEGCEEFAFALPPTRSQRYWARLTVSAGALLLFTFLDLLALGLDLPQILAKLYVDSGLIHPWPVFRSGMLYGLVMTFPLAVFASSFVLSILTHSRGLVLAASFWGLLFSLAVLRVGFWYEDFAWENLNGFFSCPLLGLVAAAVLWAGQRAFSQKEIGRHAAPISIPPRWWLWILLFLVGLLLALTLAASLAAHYWRVFALIE